MVTEREEVRERVRVRDLESEMVAVEEGVEERDAVILGVLLCVPEGDGVGVGVDDAVALGVGVTVGVAVREHG